MYKKIIVPLLAPNFFKTLLDFKTTIKVVSAKKIKILCVVWKVFYR